MMMLMMLFIGCGKQKETITSVVKQAIPITKIYSIMSDNGVYNMNSFCTDSLYSLPTENWIKTEFSTTLSLFLKSFKSSEWVTEENDCDNFSSMSYSFAQILHHNTKNKINNTGLCFGEFWYTKDINKVKHAINVIIVYENDRYKVLFFEPQTQSIVELSKTEKESCEFYKF